MLARCYACTASAHAVMPRSAKNKTHHVLVSGGVACAHVWQEALDAPVCRDPLQRGFHDGSHGVLAAQRGQQGGAGGHGLQGAGDGWAGVVVGVGGHAGCGCASCHLVVQRQETALKERTLMPPPSPSGSTGCLPFCCCTAGSALGWASGRGATAAATRSRSARSGCGDSAAQGYVPELKDVANISSSRPAGHRKVEGGAHCAAAAAAGAAAVVEGGVASDGPSDVRQHS